MTADEHAHKQSIDKVIQEMLDDLDRESWGPIRKTQDQYGFPVYWTKDGPDYVR